MVVTGRPQLVRHDAHERVAEHLPLLELGDRRLELQAGRALGRVGDRLLLHGRVEPARGPHEHEIAIADPPRMATSWRMNAAVGGTERLRRRPLLEDEPAGARHQGVAEQLVGVPVRPGCGAQHAAVRVVAASRSSGKPVGDLLEAVDRARAGDHLAGLVDDDHVGAAGEPETLGGVALRARGGSRSRPRR